MPKKIQKKKKNKTEPQVQETRPKDFLDLIAPAAVKFNTDHYICGSLYHCTLALRSYPPPRRSWPCSAIWGRKAASP